MCLFLCLIVLGFMRYKPPGNLADLPVYDFIAMVHKKRFA